MSQYLSLNMRDAPDGKGQGLFAPSHYEPGSVLLEENALFRRSDGRLNCPPFEFVRMYSRVMNWYGGLLDKSTGREKLEYLLFRTPSPHMLSSMVACRSVLESLCSSFAQLDEDTKTRHLRGLLNFYGGARMMHDLNDSHIGFGVHGSRLNHSCNPNALLCTKGLTAEETRKAEWHKGHIRIRAVRAIEAGDEVTISYDQFLRENPQARRKFLRDAYQFECKCQVCKQETSFSRTQFSTLHYDSRAIWVEGTPRPQIYRTALRFCDNAIAVGWNDRPFLGILQYLASLAAKSQDHVREKYFASYAFRWSMRFFGEDHEVTFYLWTRVRELHSLGVPTMIDEDGPDIRPLVFMLEHPDGDDCYYSLRFDDGVLSEVAESETKLLCNQAAEEQKIDGDGEDPAAEASYKPPLKAMDSEAETAERKSQKKKKKSKAKKKQAKQATEASSNVENPPQGETSRSSPREQPALPPTSTSTFTNVPKHPPTVPGQETINTPVESPFEDLTSPEWQHVVSKKDAKRAKGKQRAAETPVRRPLSEPLTPLSSSGAPSTSQNFIPSSSQPGAAAANIDPTTPPDSTEKRGARLPTSRGYYTISPSTPLNQTTAGSVPPESQAARYTSPAPSSSTPHVNSPTPENTPVHFVPPTQSSSSPQIDSPVV